MRRIDVFNLFAKLSLDSSEYNKSLGEAKSGLSKMGDSIKTGMATAAKIGAAAVVAATGAVAKLTTDAVKSYAEYEQLVGGVETLFKESADLVQEYAANAYKSAGLSANEYMETITSFSASLLQSLDGDTEKAAKIGDMAISDMADNANKMGTSMEAIQNAYQGFAKQNYTMLDNLKLGYGGTKSEMERLLEDATKLSGVEYDIESLSDVYEAIHVIQESLDITGTTAKEASTTISGSIASMKSAWKNFVTAMGEGDEIKLDDTFNALVESAETAFGNILPVVEKAIYGVVHLVEAAAPLIAEKFPGLVEKVLPPLLEAAAVLLNAVVDALPEMLEVLINELPKIIDTIVNTIVDMSPEMVELGLILIIALIDGITKALPKLMEKAPEIVKKIWETIVEHAPEMLIAAAQLLATLLTGIGEWMRPLIEKGREVVQKIASGIREKFDELKTKGREIIERVQTGFKEKVDNAIQWGRDLIQNFIDGILQKWNDLKSTVSNVAGTVKDFLGFSEPKKGPLSDFHTYAPDMMKLFAQGIADNTDIVTNQIAKSFDFGTQTIGFDSSAMGRTSAATMNAISNAGQNGSPIIVKAELKLPDDRVLADYYLQSFIDVGAARGTPIATPVKV